MNQLGLAPRSLDYGVSPVVRFGHQYSAHPYYMKLGGPRKFWLKGKLGALTWILSYKKENLPKVTLKAKKVHLSDFSLKWSPLDPYIRLTRVDINGIKSIPEFRYGSLLYPPSKIFACCYTFLGLLVTFLQKTRFSKRPLFLKMGLGGLKSKKIRSFLYVIYPLLF